MKRRLEALIAAGTLVAAIGPGVPCLGAEPAGPVQRAPDPGEARTALNAAIQDRWGVEVIALRRTANGHMLDFRYRVLDADKAAPLFERRTKPRLIHEPTGKVLAVPSTAKIGPLRNSNMPKQGRIYWMLFANAGGLVKTGDPVTVAIGAFRAEDLVVE